MSNQLTVALQSLMNQNQGEVLDVPHPVDVKDVQVKPLTAWHDSALKIDWHKEEDGDWNKTVVKGCLVEVTQLDAYGEPLGEPKLMLQHKYSHPTRQSKDVSVTAVKPFEVRKLKDRFPGVFQEYEMKLLRERAEIPLVLLDSVPPEVVQVIQTMGARTVRDFAAFDETRTDELLRKLHSHHMATRANFVPAYLARAREMIGHAPPDAPEAPSRPRRQAA